MRRISETVQRIAKLTGEEDAFGNPVEGWADPVDVGVYAFDPGSSSEPREAGRDRVIVEPALYGPYSMPFVPDDRCVARGVTYEVEGVQRDWKHPNGRTPGAVVYLRKVAG